MILSATCYWLLLKPTAVVKQFLWESGCDCRRGDYDSAVCSKWFHRASIDGTCLEQAGNQRFAGVRLVQSAYHNRSLSLYTKLGFNA